MGISIGLGPVRVSRKRVSVGLGVGPIRVSAGVGGGRRRRGAPARRSPQGPTPAQRAQAAQERTKKLQARYVAISQWDDATMRSETLRMWWFWSIISALLAVTVLGAPIAVIVMICVAFAHRTRKRLRANPETAHLMALPPTERAKVQREQDIIDDLDRQRNLREVARRDVEQAARAAWHAEYRRSGDHRAAEQASRLAADAAHRTWFPAETLDFSRTA